VTYQSIKVTALIPSAQENRQKNKNTHIEEAQTLAHFLLIKKKVGRPGLVGHFFTPAPVSRNFN
jgi:hypothetical protein